MTSRKSELCDIYTPINPFFRNSQLNKLFIFLYTLDKLDPSGLFQGYIDVLSDEIGSVANLDRIANKMVAESLITEAVYNDVTTTTSPVYQKGSKIVHELYRQIKSANKPEQVLQKICNVLQQHDDLKLKEIADKILGKLEGILQILH